VLVIPLHLLLLQLQPPLQPRCPRRQRLRRLLHGLQLRLLGPVLLLLLLLPALP
jgi:hypothetical protein